MLTPVSQQQQSPPSARLGKLVEPGQEPQQKWPALGLSLGMVSRGSCCCCCVPAHPCSVLSPPMALLPCPHTLTPAVSCPLHSNASVTAGFSELTHPLPEPPAPTKAPLLIFQLLDKNPAPTTAPSELGMLQPQPDGFSPGRAREIRHVQGDSIPWVSSHILPGCGLFWSCLLTPLDLSSKTVPNPSWKPPNTFGYFPAFWP